MRRHFLLIVCVLLAGISISQDTVLVELQLIDRQNDEYIRNANVRVTQNDSTQKYISDGNGKVFFQSYSGSSLLIHLDHFKYESKSFRKRVSNVSASDTVKFELELSYLRTQDVREIVVAAPGIPVVEFGNDRQHVSDFEFLQNGDIAYLSQTIKKGKSFDGVGWSTGSF